MGNVRRFAVRFLSLVIRIEYDESRWPLVPCWWLDLLTLIVGLTVISTLAQVVKSL